MLRRLSITSVAVVTAWICSIADCQSSDAQGLLRRIQSRIQSRIEPAPQTQPQTPAGALKSLQQRVQPELATPLTPSVRPNPAENNGREASSALSRSPRSEPPRSRQPGSQPATIDANKFGRSILAPNQPVPTPRSAPDINTGEGADSNKIVSADRPSLGIQVLQSTAGIPGLQVAGIREDSLADEAGLKVGDLIVAIDGKSTPRITDIAQYLDGLKSGDQVRARVVRGRTTTAIMIPLIGPAQAAKEPMADQGTVALADPFANAGQAAAAERAEPLPQTPIELGVQVEAQPGVRGVVVARVAADSPAAAAGLKVGDRIVSVDGRLVTSGDTFDREIARHWTAEQIPVQWVRSGKLIAADVPLRHQDGLAKTQTTKTQDVPAAGGSVLEGFGSMLGGLLGGKTPNAKANASAKVDPAAMDDTMALGDEEPIARANFESEIEPTTKKLKSDPPSLETLELPSEAAQRIELKDANGKPTIKKTAEELREEVRRLQEQLKELESGE